MTILLVLGLALLGAGVAMLVHALGRPRAASMTLVGQIGQYGFTGERSQKEEVGPRTLDRLASSLGEFLGNRLSWFNEEELRLRLISAGLYGLSPSRLFGYQFLCALAGLLAWLWLASAVASVVVVVFGAIIAVAVGWFVPLGYVWRRTKERRERIEHELPELIDLLVVAVEAGVSLSGAMRLAADQVQGPLGDELRLALQEHNMGLSTTQSLANLGVRANTPGMRIFVRSISQGQTLGISIGQVMRNLAIEMRKRRRAAAEERAQKAPVKMVFPLVLLIFPALFVVLVLPALLAIGDVLD